ncbi:MAG: M61 family metallopeptidase [Planctomycetes bacterium]|nr:M61 family metallopeptidase [Planctomycetota bacterium]
MADEPAMTAGRRKSVARATKKKATKPALHYTVSMPDPASHTFHVEIKLSGTGEFCVLAFPAWTPGSYKIREFGKNVSGFKAKGAKFEMLDKQRYRISGDCTVSFDYYADELSVRTPHLDDTHGFFLGTNLLPYLEDVNGLPAKADYTVTIKPFKGWKVATSLKGKGSTFHTDNYDVLGDTPFEVGTHSVKSFKVRGIRHDVAFYGYGNFDADRIVTDTKKIVETQAKNFGGLPYNYYLFIHHITPDSGGGLEHLNSCVCAWPSWKFKKEEDYQRFIRLVSHEFFHVWNVKRIRPKILGPFDYSKEQHTKALWIMEGMTQYYERLWCARAGVTKPQMVLDSYAETIDREDNRPGRRVMSLEDSSWLAWTKLYLADENFMNTGVSYYSRGAQVGLLLDAKIRNATGGKRSLDDVMRLAFKRWGWPKPGFAEGEWEKLAEEVAGVKLTALWRDHVRGTKEMHYDEFLDCYGLELTRDKQGNEPWLGINTDERNGALQVIGVHADGPGRKAGLQPRDEILAIDGNKVSGKSFSDRVSDLKPGAQCTLTLFRRERLVSAQLKVATQPAGKLKLQVSKKQTPQQKRNFRKWMGPG